MLKSTIEPGSLYCNGLVKAGALRTVGKASATFEAQDLLTGNPCLIREILPSQCDATAKRQFQQAARRLRELPDSPFAPLLYTFITDESCYLVESIPDGQSLPDLGIITTDIFRALLGALRILHTADPPLFHGALQPHHVVWTTSNHICLVENSYVLDWLEGSSLGAWKGDLRTAAQVAITMDATVDGDVEGIAARVTADWILRDPEELPAAGQALDFLEAIEQASLAAVARRLEEALPAFEGIHGKFPHSRLASAVASLRRTAEPAAPVRPLEAPAPPVSPSATSSADLAATRESVVRQQKENDVQVLADAVDAEQLAPPLPLPKPAAKVQPLPAPVEPVVPATPTGEPVDMLDPAEEEASARPLFQRLGPPAPPAEPLAPANGQPAFGSSSRPVLRGEHGLADLAPDRTRVDAQSPPAAATRVSVEATRPAEARIELRKPQGPAQVVSQATTAETVVEPEPEQAPPAPAPQPEPPASRRLKPTKPPESTVHRKASPVETSNQAAIAPAAKLAEVPVVKVTPVKEPLAVPAGKTSAVQAKAAAPPLAETPQPASHPDPKKPEKTPAVSVTAPAEPLAANGPGSAGETLDAPLPSLLSSTPPNGPGKLLWIAGIVVVLGALGFGIYWMTGRNTQTVTGKPANTVTTPAGQQGQAAQSQEQKPTPILPPEPELKVVGPKPPPPGSAPLTAPQATPAAPSDPRGAVCSALKLNASECTSSAWATRCVTSGWTGQQCVDERHKRVRACLDLGGTVDECAAGNR